MRYTFGADTTASRRLEKVSEIFNRSSSDFIRRALPARCVSAADLGCGPGFTTHMLYMNTRAAEIYGVDSSDEFLTSAMERFPHSVYLKHDLAVSPLPVSVDAMYARFILAHLPDPGHVLDRWASELNCGGYILSEEVEDIYTDIGVFNSYLEINKGLVASEGAELFAGRPLGQFDYRSEVVENDCVEIPVRNCDAASMFYLNTIGIWQKENYVKRNVSFEERNELTAKLLRMVNDRDTAHGIVWKMRRVVLQNNSMYGNYDLFL